MEPRRSPAVAPFRATATLDLINLAKWPASFTYEALVRLSKANVDSSTVAAGQAACACFDLSARAQEEVSLRLESLPVRGLYGKIAWFGFGLRHVLEDVADRDYGTTCIALCACLMESYPPFFGAQVLRKLCALQSAPEDMIPGSKCWQGLLQVTGGIFHASRFSTLVDMFTRFLVPESRFGVVQRGATDPESLATALLQLGQVSKGKLQSCVFSGGLDCAWLAAVAAHLFNLRTEIRAADATCLYRHQPLYCLEPSCISNALPCKHQQIEDMKNYRAQAVFCPTSETTATASLIARSSLLPNGRDLFRESALGFQNVVEFRSRSHWTSIIGDSFGAAATDLLEGPPAKHFAAFFTFVAQRAENARSRDPFVHSGETYAWPNLAFTAQMLDAKSPLLEVAMRRLPELQACLESFKKSRAAKYIMTEIDAVGHVQAIQTFCGCPACSGTQVPVKQFTCLRALAGTLIIYAGLISIAHIHKAILPTPYGLRSLYDASQPLNNRVLGDPSWRHRWPSETSDLLRSTFTLFSTSGNTHVISSNFKSALSLAADGLCCYYSILEDPNSMPPEAARVVVIPGHISFQSSIYDRIDDLKLEKEPWIEAEPLSPRDLSLYLSESIEGRLLYAAYRANAPKSSDGSDWHLFSAGAVCLFAAQKALQGKGRKCADRLRLLNHRIESPTGSETSSQVEAEPEEWFEESFWTVEFQHPANDIDAWSDFCPNGGDDVGAQYSLLIIKADPEVCDNLKIFKFSSLSFGGIYAEYARQYQMPLDRVVHYEIVRITDCLRCILSFVADIWPQRTGPQVPLPEEEIRGEITLVDAPDTDSEIWKTSEPKSRSIGFELRRDHSFVQGSVRRCALVESLQERPTPPGPSSSELPKSTLSTYVKHFKDFVVSATAAEVGLERLLQLDF